MTNPEYTWIADVLLDLVEYAELCDLHEIRDKCLAAYETACNEVGNHRASRKWSPERRHFIGTSRDAIYYSEAANMPITASF